MTANYDCRKTIILFGEGSPAFHYKFLIRRNLSNGRGLSQLCQIGRGEGKSDSSDTEAHGARRST